MRPILGRSLKSKAHPLRCISNHGSMSHAGMSEKAQPKEELTIDLVNDSTKMTSLPYS